MIKVSFKTVFIGILIVCQFIVLVSLVNQKISLANSVEQKKAQIVLYTTKVEKIKATTDLLLNNNITNEKNTGAIEEYSSQKTLISNYKDNQYFQGGKVIR
jgi:cell division protein FtsB